MKTENDYKLLRKFDPKAAIDGAKVYEIYHQPMTVDNIETDEELGTWLSGPNNKDEYIFSYPESGFIIYNGQTNMLRMAPLAWIEGKPVYKGDTLYSNIGPRTVVGSDMEYLRCVVNTGDPWVVFRAESLTWNKLKVKKSGWMNCYPNNENCTYPTKERADAMAVHTRTACVEIFWEE